MLPFDRFDGADAILGPEMRSTGEVMGIARDFPTAFAKAQAAAGAALPDSGTAFITVTDRDKAGRRRRSPRRCTTSASGSSPRAAPTRRSSAWGSRSSELDKIGEGSPNVVDWIERGDVDLVVNTPTGSGARTDGWRDPPRRRRARDPVPDDALRRARRGARDRRGTRGRGRGALAPGAPSRTLDRGACVRPRRGSPTTRLRLTWTAAGVEGRVIAPLGRRLLTVRRGASSAPTS